MCVARLLSVALVAAVAVDAYTAKVEVEKRNTEQLTKQIDVMKSKILEQVCASCPPPPPRWMDTCCDLRYENTQHTHTRVLTRMHIVVIICAEEGHGWCERREGEPSDDTETNPDPGEQAGQGKNLLPVPATLA